MIKLKPFLDVGGFNPAIIAGEEPDLCYRLRKVGGRIFHLDTPMVHHDANILKFNQWWKRSIRGGYAYANGFILHRKDKRGYYAKEVRSIIIWGFSMPLFILLLSLFVNFFFFCLYAIYPIQLLRMSLSKWKRNNCSEKDSLLFSFFTILSKVPQFIGFLTFFKRLILQKNHQIIEYK